jgi:hypothetical protein
MPTTRSRCPAAALPAGRLPSQTAGLVNAVTFERARAEAPAPNRSKIRYHQATPESFWSLMIKR